MIDFHRFPKIDAHFHATYLDGAYARIAERCNLTYVNINTDADVFPLVDEQERVALAYQKEYPGRFHYICTVGMEGWQSEDWMSRALAHIERSVCQGALGVKIWKNIGMELKKRDGAFLMVDDEFFTPLFSFLAERRIPVLAHLGEPLNCWLPLEKMTTERNRRYFQQHPQFHACLHPEIPSYQQQIEARDHVLERFPSLVFIGAHLGSMEWSYKEIARRLDTYPRFAVDVSSRLGHLQLQSAEDYDGVRDFFIRYAGRMLYGTDAYDNVSKLETSLVNDWDYLATRRWCALDGEERGCQGLELPEEVLRQIYFENARIYYGID